MLFLLRNARRNIHTVHNAGDWLSDHITAFAGSWLFLILHGLWFTVWLLLPVEHYPYGALTMIVSLEAIVLSTLVLMSQNRQAEKDRARDHIDSQEIEMTYAIDQQQLEILRWLQAHIPAPPPAPTPGESEEP